MRFPIIFLVIFMLTACSPGFASLPDPIQIESSTPLPESQRPISIPTQSDPNPMLPTNSTPSPESEKLVEIAKDDLAQRLSISTTQINLVEFEEVEWSDSSLGCPQPGMEYLQVITPGYRLLFESSGGQYEYHSNRDSYIVYCENSIQLIPPPKP